MSVCPCASWASAATARLEPDQLDRTPLDPHRFAASLIGNPKNRRRDRCGSGGNLATFAFNHIQRTDCPAHRFPLGLAYVRGAEPFADDSQRFFGVPTGEVGFVLQHSFAESLKPFGIKVRKHTTIEMLSLMPTMQTSCFVSRRLVSRRLSRGKSLQQLL
jgi:hypothetical protein